MKKAFLISLLLVSIFIIGSSGVALAQVPENCKLYLADVTVDPPEALPPGSLQECILVCYGDGLAGAVTCSDDDGYGYDILILTLEDFGVDAKNLVGFSLEWPKACHAKLRGGGLRILEADCFLDMFDGVRIHVKGKAISDINQCPCESAG
jgi:hypothetical protein